MTQFKDYRDLALRREYFSALYKLNLEHRIMPGLVYLYMPELARRFNWDAEQKLWFAFLNGMTQNPITSMRLLEQLPTVPPAGAQLARFHEWFNAEWDTLQYDTDRRYQKRDTVEAIKVYARLVADEGTQQAMLTNKSYDDLWHLVRNSYYSFGRLSSFSYLEYVYLNGFGADCSDLLFRDKSGSKSHRNGMLMLMGQDNLVWDKRQPNSHDGNYFQFAKMCEWLTKESEWFLQEFKQAHPNSPNVGRFTLESNLCTFKNHFYGRRYPGVYADMAWERIEWADARGQQKHTEVFKDIRSLGLPDWLRAECEDIPFTKNERAGYFPACGWPYRGSNFL